MADAADDDSDDGAPVCVVGPGWPALGKRSDISPEIEAFIAQQHVFFVATAARDSRVNLSPKGLDTFRVLSPTRVAYLDLTGSGNETGAHLVHDGRITFMFCSFSSKPLILRLYGRGRAVYRRQEREWSELAKHFPEHARIDGARQMIVGDIELVQCSCGYAVPEMQLVQPRPTMAKWVKQKGPAGVERYWREKNARSIDGLPSKLLED